MDEFTNEEKHRIDVIYGEDFKELTADDVKLIQRWEAYKAQENAVVQAQKDAIEKEVKARIAECKKTEKLARENLENQTAAAFDRLERVLNG